MISRSQHQLIKELLGLNRVPGCEQDEFGQGSFVEVLRQEGLPCELRAAIMHALALLDEDQEGGSLHPLQGGLLGAWPIRQSRRDGGLPFECIITMC